MNKAKWVKKIIGEAVEQYGFEYIGYSRDGSIGDYTFERRDGDLLQFIMMTTRGNEIRLEFRTNAYGRFGVEASNLIESRFAHGYENFLWFQNEDEYKEILYHFRNIILQKGLTILEEESKPTTEIRPKKETYWELYTEHERLNKEYREKFGLEETESSRKLMQKISDIILETKEQQLSEVEEMLVGLAAVYGDQIIRKQGGEYTWNEDYHTCIIREMQGGSSASPLVDVIWYWGNKEEDMDYFLQAFQRLPGDLVI